MYISKKAPLKVISLGTLGGLNVNEFLQRNPQSNRTEPEEQDFGSSACGHLECVPPRW